ncbi:MAG: sugar ABC transporter permease, partial [Nakamurella sp.]
MAGTDSQVAAPAGDRLDTEATVTARAQHRVPVRARLGKVSRPWLLLAPALIVLAALLLWPLVRVVELSLQDYGLAQIVSGKDNYIGFGNYSSLLSSPLLWKTVLPNTVIFAVVCVFGT